MTPSQNSDQIRELLEHAFHVRGVVGLQDTRSNAYLPLAALREVQTDGLEQSVLTLVVSKHFDECMLF